jgi:DNA polymerase-3 subunit delta
VKYTAVQLTTYLKRPDPAIRAFLVYGPDEGLVRERAEALGRSVTDRLDDPFRVTTLSAAQLSADPARLADEMASLSLMGGRRLVQLRNAGDGVTPMLKSVLAAGTGDALLVVEGGELTNRSSLRKLAEAAPDMVALACYADGPRDLERLIRETLAEHRIQIDAEAINHLVDHMGGDRLLTRRELEKLVLFAGEGGRVNLADAALCVGDTSALSMDDLVYGIVEGDAAAIERHLPRLFQDGTQPIQILRAMMRHLQRLHLATSRVDRGESAETIVKSLRPPVFYKHADRLVSQLRIWTPIRCGAALTALTEAELNCKRSVLPQETICRQVLLTLARAARSPRRA